MPNSSRAVFGILGIATVLLVASRVVGRPGSTSTPPDSAIANCTSKDEPAAPSGRRLALATLLVIAIAGIAIGYAIWPGFGIDENRTPVGGVLLLHDLVPSDETLQEASGVQAEVEVQLWGTGEPGVSVAELKIRFKAPRSDDHWYVIASGDWAVLPDRDPTLFCKYGNGQVIEDRVQCETHVGNPSMEFRFDEELGSFSGDDTVSASVVDFLGYDRSRVSVVSGSMPAVGDDGQGVVEVWLPIATPAVASVNGDDFFAYPPVAWLDNEYGSGPPIAEPCDVSTGNLWPLFALSQTCTPVTYVKVNGSSFDSGVDLDSRTVEYSAPDTVSDDNLRWSMESGFPGAQALVESPFAQADDSRRAFIAALLVGGGLSFALLFIERLLFHPSSRGRACRAAESTAAR